MGKHKKKKKQKRSQQAFMSEKAYLKSGMARRLPVEECIIARDWEELGKFPVIVARKHVNGNITAGFFMVDLWCTGVKDAWYQVNIPEFQYREIMAKYEEGAVMQTQVCDYALAHNLIYEALEYAGELGIDPAVEFRLASMILEEDTDDIPLMDIPVGREGKPLLMLHSDDPRNSYYFRQLDKHVGEGNYHFIRDMDPEEIEDELYREEKDYDDEDFEENPSLWSREKWKLFFRETKPEMLYLSPKPAVYLYEKCIYGPDLAGRQLENAHQTQLSRTQITYEPLESEQCSDAEQEELQALYDIITDPESSRKKLKQCLDKLKKALVKWPRNRTLYNYLYNTYTRLDRHSEARGVLDLTLDKFPDYFFAKAAKAKDYLNRGKLEEFMELFNNAYDLNSAIPGRDVFHISEFVSFATLFCNYFSMKEDLAMAFMYRSMLEEVEIPDHIALDEQLFYKLDLMIINKSIGLIKELQQDKRKQQEMISVLIQSDK